jgi:hypothetical protein
MMRGWGVGAALALALVGQAVAQAAGDAAAGKTDATTSRTTAVEGKGEKSAAGGFYVPPAPQGRLAGGRVGGGTRASRPSACNTKLSVLVPEDHVGLTTEAQPTLYFFLSQDTDCAVEFVLNDRRQVPPLIEVAVKTPRTAGIHAIRLADFGLSLEPEVDYDWFVQVRGAEAKKSPEAYGGGQIRRVTAPAGLAEELAKPGARPANVFAQNSLWYDAVAALSAEIDAAPADTALHQQRAELLASQGMDDAAASEGGGTAK